jgi:hypothetical protein
MLEISELNFVLVVIIGFFSIPATFGFIVFMNRLKCLIRGLKNDLFNSTLYSTI